MKRTIVAKYQLNVHIFCNKEYTNDTEEPVLTNLQILKQIRSTILKQAAVKCSVKVVQMTPTGAFYNTCSLHLAETCLKCH